MVKRDVNRRQGKNVAKVERVMAVQGKVSRGRSKNTWERTIKNGLEELRLTEELCGDRRE